MMDISTVTEFYKDFEMNILEEDPAGDVRIGFSLDTKAFFISDGVRWFKFELQKT